ncbi:glycolate oxidase subunit GlcE [Candidatus Endoriftia persephone]|jgi:glycolate oxidase FAD binding subunit|uniref:Glycolate oxidase subunit GlcE n=3 Tax=Gammaproteobacteria TaxID=1236 RepID=G2FEX1_9GAMM|nr:glycolate oxidase subunit GlcE [Candidatus Endoriftia persephone]EGV51965.1 glycolate oxidase subunit glcE [endosymbiont of Riftia pachyptila (vent Ph05)]EGW54703.1 glycolate oxidase subunit GlcE [endosymbiont of Tevnia jerichonana (vent Tica)]USF88420.1 glycolate oxidase subunit GlcE [Candidatus Endoriftia persephone]
MSDLTQTLVQAVCEAIANGTPLELRGGGSKRFYGREPSGTPLEISGHSGIINYEPKELVVTARAGTPLVELEAALAEQEQMLGFEPPRFGETATLGGTIACGLSGPRRPFAGAARDFVLGTRIINGRGERLRFGGEVMKNVAGYDISRLMCGAMGTLGLILDVSLKVLPRPEQEITLVQEQTPQQAIRLMNQWAAQPLPISAACHDGLQLYLRLSGASAVVRAGADRLGGERLEGVDFWTQMREQRYGFFQSTLPLWRLSLSSAAPPQALPGKQLIDWGGAQRWLRADADAVSIRQMASQAGGHASLFRGGDRSGEVFHPLPPAVMQLQRHLKRGFDPQGIFNPGRLYREL